MVRAPRVTVVGDVIADAIVRLHAPLQWASDTGANIAFAGGGSAANTASWLARLGVATTLVGRVGDDLPGRSLRDEFARAGVAAELAVDPVLPTGSLVSLVAADGQRTMLVDRGANDALDPQSLQERWFAGATLHLSGYALLHAGSRPAALRAIDLARGHGSAVSVDPSSVAPLLAVGPARFLDWTEGAALCLPNLDEARALSGQRDPVDAARSLARTYAVVVVTCGADGSVGWFDGGSHHEPAVPTEVVDTTGAGDAYAAGLLAARATGASWPSAMHAAAAVAAACVGTVGARPTRP